MEVEMEKCVVDIEDECTGAIETMEGGGGNDARFTLPFFNASDYFLYAIS